MTANQWISFLLVGLVAGWLTGKVMRGSGYGIIGDLVVGVLGALLGGWLFGKLGIAIGSGLIGAIITAFVGAVILVWVLRLMKRA